MSDYPPPTTDKLPPNISIRPAQSSDINDMAESFFRAYLPTSTFWSIHFPRALWYDWWVESWRLGLEEDPTARTFVAVDDDRDGRVVGFSRWIVPQSDGNLQRVWPPPPTDPAVDAEVIAAFFGGMTENRRVLMGTQPHWFFELVGTDAEYQGRGIGYALTKWGCDLADKDDLPVYIDASAMGAPFYQKHFGAVPRLPVDIPDREGERGHGHYEYVTHVVPRRSEREK